MRVTRIPILFLLFAVLPMAASTASAQDNVPQADRTFKGKIGKTYHDAQAYPKLFLPRSAPQGAPNVLLVLIDDAGFGVTSTFGGPCIQAIDLAAQFPEKLKEMQAIFDQMDTGMDISAPVSPDYRPPFKFSGTIEKVAIDIEK